MAKYPHPASCLKPFKGLIGLLCFFATQGLLFGWNEYPINIGDRFYIDQNQAKEAFIFSHDKDVAFPGRYTNLGQVIAYKRSHRYIFVKTTPERVFQDFPKGDSVQEGDPPEAYFFIIDRYTKTILGPLGEGEFYERSEVKDYSDIKWKPPLPPSIWKAFLFAIYYFFVYVAYVYYHAYAAMIPLTFIVLFLVWLLLRKLKFSWKE